MNSGWFSKIIEISKNVKVYKVPLFLITSFLLFSSDDWLVKLGLNLFVVSYKQYISLIFIGTGLIAIWDYYNTLWKWIKTRYYNKKSLNLIKESLYCLVDEEKSVLREFFILKKNTIKLPGDNATVAGLIDKGILVQVGKLVTPTIYGLLVPLKINDGIVKDILCEQIDLPSTIQEEDKYWLKTHRPPFMKNIDDLEDLINGRR